ncbi:MAG: CorA family divalent cation transporter [Eubacteriales bacterium]|nr:CorA family divalent cation transporter [Eubacteriales bacterium]
MFFELERGRVGILTFEELKDDYVMYGFSKETIGECEKNQYNFRSNHFVTKDFVFAVIDLIQLHDVFGEKGRVAIYLKTDLCLIVDVRDASGTIREHFESVIKRFEKNDNGLKHAVPELFLYHFLDDLMVDDRTFLENMEIQMSALETRMLSERVNPAFVDEILGIKKELMYIWNYYEQLIDVGEVLRDNENDMFPEENVRKFGIFVNRVKRINENVRDLKEYTVQLQETHDAMLDYNLNNIMKLFTVVTTIFLPLTLIVGWYGMNFQNMPELTWKYGYLGVIVFSAIVVGVCFGLFRKHRLL